MSSKNSERVMRAQRRKKEHAVESFGGKCSICGYRRCINALEFHHTENKEASPSYIIMRWSWDRVKDELKKCILVCANCHREIEYKVIDASLIPDPLPFMTKTCKQCGQYYDTKNPDQIYCGSTCQKMGLRRCDRPTRAQLSKLIATTTWVGIGRIFGVSDNAVRKWARRYGLLNSTGPSSNLG